MDYKTLFAWLIWSVYIKTPDGSAISFRNAVSRKDDNTGWQAVMTEVRTYPNKVAPYLDRHVFGEGSTPEEAITKALPRWVDIQTNITVLEAKQETKQ